MTTLFIRHLGGGSSSSSNCSGRPLSSPSPGTTAVSYGRGKNTSLLDKSRRSLRVGGGDLVIFQNSPNFPSFANKLMRSVHPRFLTNAPIFDVVFGCPGMTDHSATGAEASSRPNALLCVFKISTKRY